MECVRRYEMDRDNALAPAMLVVGSGRLANGDEGNYAELVRKFLRGFHVPPAVTELLRRLRGNPGFSEDSWRWLTQLAISVTVQVCSRGNVPEGTPPQTILLVEERDVVVDLIRAPVFALLDLVDQSAFTWRKMAAISVAVYHEPNAPMALYSYVDSRVAGAYLRFVPPLHETGTIARKLRYRAVTICGRAEPDDPVWEMTQSIARDIAASTHQPIPRKTP